MKKKIINLIIVFCSISILIEVLLNKVLIYNSINYSLKLWVNNIIPSLFPFFVFSDILLNYNVTQYIPKSIKKAFKAMFNISDHLVTIFILSMISGFPSNARNTKILYEKGKITEEEANHHPKKNMLMKAIGCTAFVEPDVTIKGFIKDDIILMCSDGLTNMLEEQEIYEIIKKEGTLAAEKLVQRANENGGYDNITAIVIR